MAADKYDQMLALADLFDSSGSDMRTRARLGDRDPRATTTSPTPTSCPRRPSDRPRRTSGPPRPASSGLLTRSVELDADALVVRATVLTYRWIDELQQAAYKTLGSIAGRAIGYLAPEVALGGAIVSAGLIETDALDRDGVTAYLNELAENNPELMDHMSGGGGLLDGLQMRSLLTAGRARLRPRRPRGTRRAARDRRRPVPRRRRLRLPRLGGIVRRGRGRARRRSTADDGTGATLARGADGQPRSPRTAGSASSGSAQVATSPTSPATHGVESGRLRLVGADPTTPTAQVVRAIEEAVTDDDARVMLVGSASGGAIAAEIAASARSSERVRGRPGRHRRRPVRPGAA